MFFGVGPGGHGDPVNGRNVDHGDEVHGRDIDHGNDVDRRDIDHGDDVDRRNIDDAETISDGRSVAKDEVASGDQSGESETQVEQILV